MLAPSTARPTGAPVGRYPIEGGRVEDWRAVVRLARDMRHEQGVAPKVRAPALAPSVDNERLPPGIQATANPGAGL